MFIKVGHQSHLLSSPHPATVPTKESRGITNKTACLGQFADKREEKERQESPGRASVDCPSLGLSFPICAVGLSGHIRRSYGRGQGVCSREAGEGPDAHGAISTGGVWVASGVITQSRSC